MKLILTDNDYTLYGYEYVLTNNRTTNILTDTKMILVFIK